jgi:hypothetical protein
MTDDSLVRLLAKYTPLMLMGIVMLGIIAFSLPHYMAEKPPVYTFDPQRYAEALSHNSNQAGKTVSRQYLRTMNKAVARELATLTGGQAVWTSGMVVLPAHSRTIVDLTPDVLRALGLPDTLPSGSIYTSLQDDINAYLNTQAPKADRFLP